MVKKLHIGIHSLVLATIFFASCMILDSCGNKDKAASSLEEAGDEFEQIVDDYSQEENFEDSFEADGTIDYSDSDESAEYSNDEVEAEVDYTSKTSSYSSGSSSQKKFMIVAGNYLLENNADDMVRKLKNSGYDTAEKVVFDLSQYFTVIAARYDDRSSADRIAKRLKGEGYDNYVLGQ